MEASRWSVGRISRETFLLEDKQPSLLMVIYLGN